MTTIILTTDQVKAKLFELLAGQQTPMFISVRNYRNEQNELSNYVINIGASYENAKLADTEKLKVADNFKDIDFGKVAAFSEEARIALLEAILNPSSNHSKGQIEAYETICPNVRMHLETGRLFIYGFRISKEVLEKGTYKPVNSRPLTIAKDLIRETLKATKFRNFCIDKITEVRMKGNTLEFEL